MSIEVQALSTIHTNVCSASDRIKPIKNRFGVFFNRLRKIAIRFLTVMQS